jgi:hypothetical protein
MKEPTPNVEPCCGSHAVHRGSWRRGGQLTRGDTQSCSEAVPIHAGAWSPRSNTRATNWLGVRGIKAPPSRATHSTSDGDAHRWDDADMKSSATEDTIRRSARFLRTI